VRSIFSLFKNNEKYLPYYFKMMKLFEKKYDMYYYFYENDSTDNTKEYYQLNGEKNNILGYIDMSNKKAKELTHANTGLIWLMLDKLHGIIGDSVQREIFLNQAALTEKEETALYHLLYRYFPVKGFNKSNLPPVIQDKLKRELGDASPEYHERWNKQSEKDSGVMYRKKIDVFNFIARYRENLWKTICNENISDQDRSVLMENKDMISKYNHSLENENPNPNPNNRMANYLHQPIVSSSPSSARFYPFPFSLSWVVFNRCARM